LSEAANCRMNTPSTQFECTIRTALAEDYPQMAELSRQLGYESTADDVAARMAAMRESTEHAVFVAELVGGQIGGQIGGWIGAFVLRSVEAEARAEVSGLVVDARVRSKGVGQRLLERAEKWAREKKCGTIGLRTNVVRERAHIFYERQGYRHTKTQRSYRKEL
jgi:GNAT superfamily N-acetyltransferase